MILVTGGTGYLGGHIAQRFVNAGHRVRVFDVEDRKYRPSEAEFAQGDMRCLEDVRRCMEDVTDVIHCAFIQSLSKRSEEDKWLANIVGTQNFLRVAAERNIRKFVHTSTIEIYGTFPPVPCREDAPTDEPAGWYGRHKLECEFLCRESIRAGLPVTLLRLPSICGPGHYNHGPLLDVMDRLIDSKPLPVVGFGSVRGTAVHLEDALDGFMLAWEKEASVGEAFNISSDVPATQLEIMRAMAQAVGSRTKFIPIPASTVRPFVRLADRIGLADCPEHQLGYLLHDAIFAVDKAKHLLGFQPKHSTAESFAYLISTYAQDREYIRQRQRNY